MTTSWTTRGRRRRPATTVLVAVAGLTLTACATTDSASSSASGNDSGSAVSRLQLMAPADPGGGWDGTARAMAASIEGAGLAESTTVTNVPGAGGTIGLAQLANEKSEDYLMVMGLVMVGAIETNQSPATLDDVTPIARLTAEDEIIVVPADSPYKTIQDLGDDLAARGRKVAIAGGSAGGTDHIVAGLLAKAVGAAPTDLNYVAFSGGGESLAALLGSKVAAGVSGVSEYAEQVKAGKLRALAVTGPERVDGIDAPTLTEAGYDIEFINWRGVVAPKALSAEATDRLVTLVTEMHDSPEWKEALATNGWTDTFLAGDEFASFIEAERETTTTVLRDLGLVG
ncbi:MAG TPA: tripartite tricarboxylate transporter substrate-binding protein [Actinomycetes bacterium]|nr:tripartite tricarboxylate transporter substrate-binding protein [Actinomycetes bacterium]